MLNSAFDGCHLPVQSILAKKCLTCSLAFVYSPEPASSPQAKSPRSIKTDGSSLGGAVQKHNSSDCFNLSSVVLGT